MGSKAATIRQVAQAVKRIGSLKEAQFLIMGHGTRFEARLEGYLSLSQLKRLNTMMAPYVELHLNTVSRRKTGIGETGFENVTWVWGWL